MINLSAVLLAGTGTSNPNVVILMASAVLILSYIFGQLAKKTNVPSVLMLIALGILMQFGSETMGISQATMMGALPVLGVVGLIMIVMEAALDLELRKDKIGLINKALFSSLLGLVACAFAIGAVFALVFSMETGKAILYAVPLSILSSAIIIPSIGALPEKKKEYLIYESTFSDILGIVMFYLVINLIEESNDTAVFLNTGLELILLVIGAVAVSFAILAVFKNVTAHGRYALLMSVLLSVYALAKLRHLSALIIILVFGLVINNHRLFLRGPFKNLVNEEAMGTILRDCKLVTGEAAFVIRTFFFVIFGYTIALTSLVSLTAILVSLVVLVLLYFVRFLSLRLFLGKDFLPELFIAPRGLITILLFFSIPTQLEYKDFNSGILIYVILITGGVMTYAMINKDRESALERWIWGRKEEPEAELVEGEEGMLGEGETGEDLQIEEDESDSEDPLDGEAPSSSGYGPSNPPQPH